MIKEEPLSKFVLPQDSLTDHDKWQDERKRSKQRNQRKKMIKMIKNKSCKKR